MKKLSNLEFSKMSLDELKQVGTVLDAEDQRKYIGGTSISEAYAMMNAGTWTGGYVAGMGYVSAQSFTLGGGYDSSNYFATSSAYTRDQKSSAWNKFVEEFMPSGTGMVGGHMENLALEGIARLQDLNYNGPIYVLFDSNAFVGNYGNTVPRLVIRSAMSGEVLYDSHWTSGYGATGNY